MTRDEATGIWMASFNAWCEHPLPANERVAREAAATVIQQAFAEREERLADHVAVHRAMLQGHIAKPSPANIWHLYQKDLLDAMPDEFKDVRYSRADVDAYIDEARQALAAKGDSRG